MQGFMILAIIGTEKDILVFYLTLDSDKVNGAWNVGQGYWVMVRACRVCQGKLLCKQGIMILTFIGTEKDTLVF